ncbi:MAG: alpha-glucan phosphorylase [Planctomycetota bacterium]|nr:MAG: alpha-glucan phosphorylase [Planctomycetota bacterium]
MADNDVIAKLWALANNLWWSWHRDVRFIFRDLDAKLYRACHRNPVALLRRIDPEVLTERVHDLEMLARIDRAVRELNHYLESNGAWGALHGGPLNAAPVAYFCFEFGIHESLPIYSGGLGVLAGDHLKAASDLGVPIVGLGLIYHQGYVHQRLDASGWQQDPVERVPLDELPLHELTSPDGTPLRVRVELPESTVVLRARQAMVGRSRLLLLTAQDPDNPEPARELTARLYWGDMRVRIQQELLLGVGGMRMLQAAGIEPSVIHLNEGHTAFALLEAARQLREREGLDGREALAEVGRRAVFTTHTPVPAGHDHFPAELAAAHLAPLAAGLGMPLEELLGLGRVRPEEHGAAFLPTVLALRLARHRNAVSALHAEVTRRMWRVLWPERPEEEVPIGHITNGVHVESWMAPEMHELLELRLGPEWRRGRAEPQAWQGIAAIEDGELWELHLVLKARLLAWVRRHVQAFRARLGRPLEPVPLDEGVLTIGFARRFATYKRATLLLDDLERLDRLVNHPERPVQFIFAGRAHPHDEGGKAFVQRIDAVSRDPRFSRRIVFIENHNMHVGRQLVQGVDAWLNNPRRPLEACGTSGQKVVLNGGLNISIPDGWWAEAYDGRAGFAIGRGHTHRDPALQDARDREDAFRVLEEEVAPLFYERDAQGLPRRWIARVKHAMQALGWRFNAERMVRDYTLGAYLPAAGGLSAALPPRRGG